jgi:MoxR-like ATPase
MSAREAIKRLKDNITSVYMGNTAAVDRVVVCLLARGHLLIEDVPGVGKTVLANALARSIRCSFARVQCTPDLLPTDIIGVSVYDRERRAFEFKAGPIFNHIILADEINRTTPRTQSALLEAMSETSISVDGKLQPLPQPFMVVATQNPYEFEGTYFLPENQLDRFLMRINLGYPAPDDESRIIEMQPARTTLQELQPVMTAEEVLHLQDSVDGVRMDQVLVDYIIALAEATRENEDTIACPRTSSPTCCPSARTASSARPTCMRATPPPPAVSCSRCSRRSRAQREKSSRPIWTARSPREFIDGPREPMRGPGRAGRRPGAESPRTPSKRHRSKPMIHRR